MTEPQRYRVYLLRLWQAKSEDDAPVWRVAPADARTGERHGFAALPHLCAFLEEQTANWTGRDAPKPKRES